MKNIIQSLSVALMCFSILLALNILNESIADSEDPPPAIAEIGEYFSPIGPFLFILPALAGSGHYLHSRKNKEQNLTLSLVLSLGAVLIMSTATAIGQYTMLLNGTREVELERIIGNVTLFGILILINYIELKRPNQSLLDNA
jgi:hypothetical protein